jgi:hypothetical protein
MLFVSCTALTDVIGWPFNVPLVPAGILIVTSPSADLRLTGWVNVPACAPDCMTSPDTLIDPVPVIVVVTGGVVDVVVVGVVDVVVVVVVEVVVVVVDVVGVVDVVVVVEVFVVYTGIRLKLTVML